MVNFDDIDDWALELSTTLKPHVPDSVIRELAAKPPELIKDARDMLFDLTSCNAVIDATLAWIRSNKIAGYHGSRLTEEELASVRANGLMPLKAASRRRRLLRVLSQHPNWNSVKKRFDIVIRSHGQGGAAGNRENKVYLTLSRAGLTGNFDHYLTHGSEFDQQVAHALLGQEGVDLLAHDGEPRVIQVVIPGQQALNAAHPHFTIDELRHRGDVPSLVDDFLKAWSYRLAWPLFQSRTLQVGCDMTFGSPVPATWIITCETLTERFKSTQLQNQK